MTEATTTPHFLTLEQAKARLERQTDVKVALCQAVLQFPQLNSADICAVLSSLVCEIQLGLFGIDAAHVVQAGSEALKEHEDDASKGPGPGDVVN